MKKQAADVVTAAVSDGNASVRSDESIQAIAEALRGLRFGTVTVIVQDGVVVQVERTEKRRLTR